MLFQILLCEELYFGDVFFKIFNLIFSYEFFLVGGPFGEFL